MSSSRKDHVPAPPEETLHREPDPEGGPLKIIGFNGHRLATQDGEPLYMVEE